MDLPTPSCSDPGMSLLSVVPETHPPPTLDRWLAIVRAARFCDGLRCPRCESPHVQKWGRFSGRQRFRCRGGCGRTFSDLTLTPAAYIKKTGRWMDYQRCLAASMTLRQAADLCSIHVSTSFRWRHRILARLAKVPREQLCGVVELTLMRIPESMKGSRDLARPPRVRGIDAFGWWTEPHADVLIAADRQGRVQTALLEVVRRGRSPLQVAAALEGLLDSEVVFRVEYGGAGVHWGRTLSRLSGGRDELRDGHDRAEVLHANAYRFRLRAWLRGFRGVATRYLEHYLTWHRHLDQAVRQGLGEAAIRWPLP